MFKYTDADILIPIEKADSKYQTLSQIAIAICLTPHSNPTAE